MILNKFLIENGADEFNWWELEDALFDEYCYDCKYRKQSGDELNHSDCSYRPLNCNIIQRQFGKD